MLGFQFWITLIVYIIVIFLLESFKPQMLYDINGEEKTFDTQITSITTYMTVPVISGILIFGIYIITSLFYVMYRRLA